VANVLFSALTLSCAIIGLHGATRVPDDLFLDEADVSTFGERTAAATAAGTATAAAAAAWAVLAQHAVEVAAAAAV
jgi:hypothetical protein